ncbi:MAG TPA: enoyl-CoA hydratase/isomerase family protein [Mycobacteriales bacterium]|nr:enoyl-CoA hydratase/isomerase family protein [Mycobacteriales bacterium]
MTEPTTEQPILVEDPRPGVRRIVFNRPERLNAITAQLIADMHDALDDIGRDSSVRAVVLTGSGRGFCAGADIKGGWVEASGGSATENYRQQYRLSELAIRLTELRVPVIAAVNGPAVGGGFALALSADIRYASIAASFAVANVRIGLSGGEMGMSYLLPRTVGRGKAAELMLSGRKVDAQEALACHLVERVVAPEALDGAVDELLGQILQNAPFGVSLTKEMLMFGDDAGSFRQAVLLDNRTQLVAGASGDVAEAVAAFREGRAPQFGG